MASSGTSRFQPYMRMPRTVAPRTWQRARIAVLALSLLVIAFVALSPSRGLMAVWQLLIPALPILFAVAPGLWRQICPMAFLNQIPIEKGWSREASLPPVLQDHAYLIAVLGFAGAIVLRRPLLADSATATSALLMLALAAAFAGGLYFKGRSGWCGTFCPLSPLQKIYGHAPPVVVPNGYCATCVGCQRNCYDFNPLASIHADMGELPARLTEHRALFSALLPGLVLGAWLADPWGQHGTARYLAEFTGYILGSLGSFYAAKALLPIGAYRLTAVFGMAGFVLFYWFEAAPMTGALSALSGIQLPYPLAANLIFMTAVGVAARVLWAGFDNARAYATEREAAARTSFAVEAVALAEGRRAAATPVIRDRSSERSFTLDPDRTLLEVFESGGLTLAYGCRSGACGADPIAIVDGQEHLSPADPIELATLERLGLAGKARLACVCRARGPLVVDLRAALDARTAPALAPAASNEDERPDLAARAGIRRVVIVGNGVAGSTAADLLRRDSPTCRIDLISRESRHFYNRMALGRVVSSHSGLDGLQLMSASWFEQRRISVWLSTIVHRIDPDQREVHLATGETLPYDRLILATGAAPILPAVPGARLPGVFVLREADDAIGLRTWSQAVATQASASQRPGHREAVVVGGGVLGVEAASALVDLGLRVTIVHREARLMNRHLDAEASAILERFLTGKGVQVRTAVSVERLVGDDLLQGVTVSDGETIDAQMCVFCVGIRPNVSLAAAADLRTSAGIIVDDGMRTSRPDIFAIGDATDPEGPTPSLWTVAGEHAERAVATMLDRPAAAPTTPHVMHLKISGIDIRAFGMTTARRPGQIEYVDPDASDSEYRKIVCENGRIIGAVFAGPPGSARLFATLVGDGSTTYVEGENPFAVAPSSTHTG